MKTYRITQRSTGAFSLVEVTLALGVAGFCLIAILGLLPAGLNTNQTSIRQTTANGIMSSIVADLRATPSTLTQSAQFGVTFQQTKTLYFAGDGRVVTQGDPNAIFFATVTFSSSGGGSGGADKDNDTGGGGSTGGSATASFADVKVGWPAAAGAGGSGGSGGGGGDSDTGDSDAGGGGSGGSGGSSAQATAAGIVETFVGLDRNPSSTSSNGGGDSDN